VPSRATPRPEAALRSGQAAIVCDGYETKVVDCAEPRHSAQWRASSPNGTVTAEVNAVHARRALFAAIDSLIRTH
jgi:hypothetical protein